MSSNKGVSVYYANGKEEPLGTQNYVSHGGEATVYQKGGTAFKIMLPGKKVISTKKINELSSIKADNVLIPKEHLFDKKGDPIGFTMTYVHGCEFLCKLLNGGYKRKNNFSETEMVDFVKELQKGLISVHEANCLAVDFNQMNFMWGGRNPSIPYFIDTDSYQTPSFPATALMECVRDRQVSNNKFTKHSDWFSWGCVAFWLYTGAHPYRGRHPDYVKDDWNGKRMDDEVSIFNNDVTPPPNAAPFSVIPPSHLSWFKEVFHKNNRSIPPFPDGAIVITPGIRLQDVADFLISEVMKYDGNINEIEKIRGNRYVITKNSVWRNNLSVFNLPSTHERTMMCDVENADPILAFYDKEKLKIFDWRNNTIVKEQIAQGVMKYNGKIYTLYNNELLEHKCQKFQKIIHTMSPVANIFAPTAKIFDGVVAEDMLGKFRLTVPYDSGSFKGIFIPELDGKRVIDAKFLENVCVVITEESGKNERHVITFSQHRTDYHVRTSDAQIGDSADFAIKSKGLCIGPVNGDDLETWKGDSLKVFTDGPIPAGSMMYMENDETMFIQDDTLLTIKKK